MLSELEMMVRRRRSESSASLPRLSLRRTLISRPASLACADAAACAAADGGAGAVADAGGCWGGACTCTGTVCDAAGDGDGDGTGACVCDEDWSALESLTLLPSCPS